MTASHLRILHVAEAFGGGIFEIVRTLAAGTAARGHEVTVAHGRRPETPVHPRGLIDASVRVEELAWRRRTPGAHLRAGMQLRTLVRALRPDVVHLHSSYAGVVGVTMLPKAAPLIYTPNAYAAIMREGTLLRRGFYARAEAFSSRRVDVLGAVSEHEAQIARSYGAKRIEIVPNGIPELDDDDTERPAYGGPARVVALGRTVPQRRPEACARILAAMRDVAEVEWIGGGGGDRGARGHRALLEHSIPLTGWLPHDQAMTQLGRATAYLHWTAWDGLALSVMEAMARDVVVVASDIPPNRELLGPDQVCASERDAIALLRRIISEPAFARELQARQRERRRCYSASRMVENWLQVYDRAVAGYRRDGGR